MGSYESETVKMTDHEEVREDYLDYFEKERVERTVKTDENHDNTNTLVSRNVAQQRAHSMASSPAKSSLENRPSIATYSPKSIVNLSLNMSGDVSDKGGKDDRSPGKASDTSTKDREKVRQRRVSATGSGRSSLLDTIARHTRKSAKHAEAEEAMRSERGSESIYIGRVSRRNSANGIQTGTSSRRNSGFDYEMMYGDSSFAGENPLSPRTVKEKADKLLHNAESHDVSPTKELKAKEKESSKVSQDLKDAEWFGMGAVYGESDFIGENPLSPRSGGLMKDYDRVPGGNVGQKRTQRTTKM
jgi:hypothetical protein